MRTIKHCITVNCWLFCSYCPVQILTFIMTVRQYKYILWTSLFVLDIKVNWQWQRSQQSHMSVKQNKLISIFISFNFKMFELYEGRTLLPLYLTLLLVMFCDFVLPGGNYLLFWMYNVFTIRLSSTLINRVFTTFCAHWATFYNFWLQSFYSKRI